MKKVFEVLSAGGMTTVSDNWSGNHDVRFLTLGDKNPASGNRYYVSLSGEDAAIDWQSGDCIMVDLSLLAYKHEGCWHISHCSDAMNLIEIDTNVNNDENSKF